MNSPVLTPHLPPLNIPWFEEDDTQERHDYFLPRSFALYLLRVVARYPSVESMALLGDHPLHYAVHVRYTDGAQKLFRHVDEVLAHWADLCWHPPARA